MTYSRLVPKTSIFYEYDMPPYVAVMIDFLNYIWSRGIDV